MPAVAKEFAETLVDSPVQLVGVRVLVDGAQRDRKVMFARAGQRVLLTVGAGAAAITRPAISRARSLSPISRSTSAKVVMTDSV